MLRKTYKIYIVVRSSVQEVSSGTGRSIAVKFNEDQLNLTAQLVVVHSQVSEPLPLRKSGRLAFFLNIVQKNMKRTNKSWPVKG
ncbi:hypothetical protein QJ48_09535 [Paenibacillus sp. A3]|nr:hypothetical protein QJ48_09535 [Paenibacillus sp. A3]